MINDLGSFLFFLHVKQPVKMSPGTEYNIADHINL